MKDVHLSFFAFRWIVCLLVREFRLPNAMLVWDSYMALGDCFPRYHLFVCASLIMDNEKSIKGLDMYNIVNHMQSMPCMNWSPANLRCLLEKAVILSEQYPFPDDPSSQNRRVIQRTKQQDQGSLAALSSKVFSQVEGSKLVEMLAVNLRRVLDHFSSNGTPIPMKQAKRIVARIVIIAAVCLIVTGSVMAIRKMYGANPDGNTM